MLLLGTCALLFATAPDVPGVSNVSLAPQSPSGTSSAPDAAQLIVSSDPYVGSWRAKEMGAAAIGVLLADGFAVVGGWGANQASGCTRLCRISLGFVSFPAAIWPGVLADILLTPLFATAFARWQTDPGYAGSVWKTLLLTEGAKLGEVLTVVIAYFAAMVSPVVGWGFLGLAALIHYVGTPVVASCGLHWSGSTRPSESTSEHLSGVPVLSW